MTGKDEVKVHPYWLNVIRFCQKVMPYGTITITIRDSLPVECEQAKRKIRFDKPETLSFLDAEEGA